MPFCWKIWQIFLLRKSINECGRRHLTLQVHKEFSTIKSSTNDFMHVHTSNNEFCFTIQYKSLNVCQFAFVFFTHKHWKFEKKIETTRLKVKTTLEFYYFNLFYLSALKWMYIQHTCCIRIEIIEKYRLKKHTARGASDNKKSDKWNLIIIFEKTTTLTNTINSISISISIYMSFTQKIDFISLRILCDFCLNFSYSSFSSSIRKFVNLISFRSNPIGSNWAVNIRLSFIFIAVNNNVSIDLWWLMIGYTRTQINFFFVRCIHKHIWKQFVMIRFWKRIFSRCRWYCCFCHYLVSFHFAFFFLLELKN